MGLYHQLPGQIAVAEDADAVRRPVGQSLGLEGFGIEQLMSLLQLPDDQCFTWSLQSGSEVDLVLTLPGGLVGIEFKAGDAPGKTRSMSAAVETLKLRKLYIVYPGEKDYEIDSVVEAIGVVNLPRLRSLTARKSEGESTP